MSTSCTTSSAVGDDVHTAVVSVSVLSFLSVSVLKKKEHLFNYKSLMKNIEIVFKINANCPDPAIPSNFTRIREIIFFHYSMGRW